MTQRHAQVRRRGAAAVLAMLFLVLMTTLTLAMYSMATGNVQSASNLADAAQARNAAEAGLRWINYRFSKMARPKTTIGNITPEVADSLWPSLQQAIVDDLTISANKMLVSSERNVTTDDTSVTLPPISTESSGASFSVVIRQNPADATYLDVYSTGTYRQATRTVSMAFKIDKKIKFAVVGKVPIQLGRNTIVEGPVAVAFDSASWLTSKGPPILMLSDFMHFDATLRSQLEAWNTFLQTNHNGFDNRVSVNNSVEYNAATNAGYTDYNGDAYIDEYDMFVKRFDSNGDKAVDATEFTNSSTGKLYDANLFDLMDSINGPMFAGDPERLGYKDGKIDNSDGYAKLRGQLLVSVTADQWQDELDNPSRSMTKFPYDEINDYIQGTIAPTEPTDVPVQFGVPTGDMLDLDPANFEGAATNFKNKTATGSGSVNTASYKENLILSGSMANAGTATERTPYGSTAYQATYKRPVFQNMTFKNCRIPKGLNALFKNCTFEGVTFVDNERDITTSTGMVTYDSGQGMSWSQSKLSGSGSFSKDSVLLSSGTVSTGQLITKGSQKGNNLRFDGCTFNGPLAGNYATAYTHFANSWEFTGATVFNNQVDDTATIVSPQVNIEMGSFTNPGDATSTMIGVVVAGNFDVRGSSNVDGSIIITGNGAGNTTLAYFGASDGSTDPDAPMPEGGWGQLNIRYNPNRALPDGINMPIDVTAQTATYSEGVVCPG